MCLFLSCGLPFIEASCTACSGGSTSLEWLYNLYTHFNQNRTLPTFLHTRVIFNRFRAVGYQNRFYRFRTLCIKQNRNCNSTPTALKTMMNPLTSREAIRERNTLAERQFKSNERALRKRARARARRARADAPHVMVLQCALAPRVEAQARAAVAAARTASEAAEAAAKAARGAARAPSAPGGAARDDALGDRRRLRHLALELLW